MAPSGVLLIGLSLVLRDFVHETSGAIAAMVAIAIGCLLSFTTSPPAIALASAVAFGVAETADLIVYARLRAASKPMAVLASQIVGAVIDSSLFVLIAFGSIEFAAGTTWAKVWAGFAVALALAAINRRKATR